MLTEFHYLLPSDSAVDLSYRHH